MTIAPNGHANLLQNSWLWTICEGANHSNTNIRHFFHCHYSLSLKLPHPITVPICPCDIRLADVGIQIGRTLRVKVTGISMVNTATSLYNVRESKFRWRTTRLMRRSTCCTSWSDLMLWSPRRTVNRATSQDDMLRREWKPNKYRSDDDLNADIQPLTVPHNELPLECARCRSAIRHRIVEVR